MSVAELRDRLAEISSSISLQKKLLDDLERARVDIYRQLNTILDPISRLPFEISSDIFVLCLPSLRHPNPSTVPILFLSICATWADIALSTPALWDTIHVDFPRAKGFNRVLRSYLTRSATRELSITLTGPPDGACCRLIRRNAPRVKDLKLQLRSEDDLMRPQATIFSNLKTLTISSALKASSETLFDLPMPSLLDVLRAVPGLVDCTIDNTEVDPWDEHPPLTVPLLRHLRLGRHSTVDSSHSAKVLSHLSLPALQSLVLSSIDDISAQDFITFFVRSAAPLQSLRINLEGRHWWQPPILTQLFGAMPTLTDLHLFWLTECAPFLRLLLTDILPELRILRLVSIDWSSSPHHDAQPDASSCFALLPPALSARRAKMVSFQLRLGPNLERPDDLVIAHLRQLSTECGMKVHVGTKKISWV
ncbi:hypothetical protein C8J57DRAFT_137960, partial [Mycena rebaudengoi]